MDAFEFHELRNIVADPIRRWLLKRPRIASRFVRGTLPNWIEEHDAIYGGLKWKLHPMDNAKDRAIWLCGQTDEEADIDRLMSRFSARRICFFDIGANSGIYAVRIGKVIAPESKIFAVEPNPIMSERLRTNLVLNNISNVRVLDCAVAAESGEMRLRFPNPRNLGMASLHPVVGTSESDIRVTVNTLAELVKKHDVDRIDLLKIDVEGFEDRVLSPYFETVSDESLPEVILLEHLHQMHWKTDLLQMALSRGYTLAVENKMNWLLELADR